MFRGDPEKCDNYGNTGLHLSAAKVRASFILTTWNLWAPVEVGKKKSAHGRST